NPNLKVGFNHSINTSYHSYKVLSSRYFYVYGYYSATSNAITNSSTIDLATGKRVYTPINVDGNNNWNIGINWSRGQGEKKFRHNIYSNTSGGRNVVLINNNKGFNNYLNYEINYGISYSVTDKYNFSLGPKIGHNYSRSSLQTRINNNFYTYGGRANGYVMLPGKIELSSDVNLDLRQRIAVFNQNTNIVQWNGAISRKVFKDKSGKIFFVANDILNQNKGYNRSINGETIVDSRFLRVSRFFLLKFEWTFNKMPAVK
ncbi:MAG TPA: outer membrane beta-barrel protein, partial [Chitinophagaceae bacterium]|nr:outer membrane beta-barrel protein [Chitinophagaceae bacterium]